MGASPDRYRLTPAGPSCSPLGPPQPPLSLGPAPGHARGFAAAPSDRPWANHRPFAGVGRSPNQSAGRALLRSDQSRGALWIRPGRFAAPSPRPAAAPRARKGGLGAPTRPHPGVVPGPIPGLRPPGPPLCSPHPWHKDAAAGSLEPRFQQPGFIYRLHPPGLGDRDRGSGGGAQPLHGPWDGPTVSPVLVPITSWSQGRVPCPCPRGKGRFLGRGAGGGAAQRSFLRSGGDGGWWRTGGTS